MIFLITGHGKYLTGNPQSGMPAKKNSPYLHVTFAASLFGGRWNRYFGYPSIMT